MTFDKPYWQASCTFNRGPQGLTKGVRVSCGLKGGSPSLLAFSCKSALPPRVPCAGPALAGSVEQDLYMGLFNPTTVLVSACIA